jgi:hypothetical protein
MYLYSNHIYCNDSNWGGSYDCRYLLSIERNSGKGDGERGSYYDAPHEDWTNVVDEDIEFFDEKEYDRLKETDLFKKYGAEELKELFCMKDTVRLKPEVIKWLNENIADQEGVKGWCTYSDSKAALNTTKLTIFFRRKNDALAFVRYWSSLKKVHYYFNYFRGKHLELNPTTKKYERVEKITRY